MGASKGNPTNIPAMRGSLDEEGSVMKRQRRGVIWFIGLGLGLALLLTVGDGAKTVTPAVAQQPLQKFRMILWGPRIPEGAWAFLAEDQGLFREEGLDVEVIPAAGGGGEALKMLLGGAGEPPEEMPHRRGAGKGERVELPLHEALAETLPGNIRGQGAIHGDGIDAGPGLPESLGEHLAASLGTRKQESLSRRHQLPADLVPGRHPSPLSCACVGLEA